MRLWWIGLAGAVGVAAPLGCAGEGEIRSDEPIDAGRDVGHVVTDAGGLVDADADAAIDSCSLTGLCAVPAPIDTSINLMSISGSSASDVWAVGTSRTILHYDGSVWEKHTIPDGISSPVTMRAVWVGRPDDVWIADGFSLRHSSGWKGNATDWSTYYFHPPGVGSGNPPLGISGKDGSVWIARAAWAVYDPQGSLIKCDGWGDGGVLVNPEHLGFNGDYNNFFGAGYDAVAMTRAGEAWATSAGLSRSTGARVVRVVRSEETPPVWRHEEFDSRTSRHLHGVWGNEDVVWLVGEGGAARRMTRAALPSRAFEVVETPVTADLRGVFGFGDDDVWAVGDESTVLHWDGKSWTKLVTPFDSARVKPHLFSVWGSSKTDVWIVGNGVVLHFDGRGR